MLDFMQSIISALMVKLLGDRVYKLPMWLVDYLEIYPDYNKSNQFKLEGIKKSIQLNEDGSGKRYKEWVGVSTRNKVNDYNISNVLRIECLNPSIDGPYVLETDNNHTVEIISSDPTMIGTFNELYSDERIHIKGPLGFESKASLKLCWNFNGIFAMEYGSAKKAYKDSVFPHEYVSLKVPTESKCCEVSISFPNSFVGSFEVEPYMTSFEDITTESIHEYETAHIRSNKKDYFRSNSNIYTFEYDSPVPGVSYAICWMPP